MFSRREVEAVAMKNRAKFILQHLPEWMQQPVGKDNDEMLTFPYMDSKIQSFPSVEGSGRMESATLVVMDEWAFQPYATTNYAAILPVVEHGKLVGISTANGKGNLFFELYDRARRGENSFTPMFVPFTVRPGRDMVWWEQQKRDMPTYLALQEYPLREEDAFIVAGTCMFDVKALSSMPIIPPLSSIGYFETFVSYDETHEYVAGIDTALGIEGRDYSILQIVDVTTGEQAAKLRTQVPIEQFSDMVVDALEFYGRKARVIIEEQPQGRVVYKALVDRKYPDHLIYRRSKNVPCWVTGKNNRAQILMELESATRTGTLRIHAQDTIDEMLAFGYDEKENKFEALSGHDDEVMSLALANHLVVSKPPTMTDFTPKTYETGKRELTSFRDINWKAKDPFKHARIEHCPECGGMRYLESGVCKHCRGAGVILCPNSP